MWSQTTGMLVKRPVVRGPRVIPASFTPDSAGLTAPNLTQIVAAICNNFEFCFVLFGSSLVSLPS